MIRTTLVGFIGIFIPLLGISQPNCRGPINEFDFKTAPVAVVAKLVSPHKVYPINRIIYGTVSSYEILEVKKNLLVSYDGSTGEVVSLPEIVVGNVLHLHKQNALTQPFDKIANDHDQFSLEGIPEDRRLLLLTYDRGFPWLQWTGLTTSGGQKKLAEYEANGWLLPIGIDDEPAKYRPDEWKDIVDQGIDYDYLRAKEPATRPEHWVETKEEFIAAFREYLSEQQQLSIFSPYEAFLHTQGLYKRSTEKNQNKRLLKNLGRSYSRAFEVIDKEIRKDPPNDLADFAFNRLTQDKIGSINIENIPLDTALRRLLVQAKIDIEVAIDENRKKPIPLVNINLRNLNPKWMLKFMTQQTNQELILDKNSEGKLRITIKENVL